MITSCQSATYNGLFTTFERYHALTLIHVGSLRVYQPKSERTGVINPCFPTCKFAKFVTPSICVDNVIDRLYGVSQMNPADIALSKMVSPPPASPRDVKDVTGRVVGTWTGDVTPKKGR